MTEIICALITAASGIIVALLSISIKRANDKSERRAKVRQKESLLSMKMIDASMQLAIVSANALMDYKNNGNVEQAYKAANEATAEYQAFMQEVTAHEIGK